MATHQLIDDVIDRPDDDAQRRALVASLRAAVEALTACVEAVYSVIEHVDALAVSPEATPAPARPRITYGGGPSTLVSTASAGAEGPAWHPGAESSPPSPEPVGDPAAPVGRFREIAAHPGPRVDPGAEPLLRQPRDPQPGASALMAAADMAHEGYTTDEIAERLRLRWGDRAASILRDLMD